MINFGKQIVLPENETSKSTSYCLNTMGRSRKIFEIFVPFFANSVLEKFLTAFYYCVMDPYEIITLSLLVKREFGKGHLYLTLVYMGGGGGKFAPRQFLLQFKNGLR